MKEEAPLGKEFYSKFLTANQAKASPKETKQPLSNQLEKKERGDDQYNTQSTNNRNGLLTAEPSSLSQMTYGLFVNQTKERLFKTFFKNQQDNIAIQQQKRHKSPKMNLLKAKRKEEVKPVKKREDKANTELKKKEYYEDIIKANRDCIRVNPFLSTGEENERKFQIDHLNTDKVVEIEIENEVQLRREQTELKHKEILSSKIPELFEKIRLVEQNKYFIKNKYTEALENFEG